MDGTIQLERLDYIYDAANNVDTITDSIGLHDYNYNGLDELTQAIHPAASGLTAENYAYDRVGNREDPVDAALYNYDSNNRITASPGITSYVFDNDGNMTSNANGETYTYNHINRLTNFTKTGTTASYLYDPFGKRLNKTVNGTTTWFLWDRNKLLTEYNNSGLQQIRYAYLPNSFTPIQVADVNGIYDVFKDHLEAPRLLINSSKSIVWSAQYESFGKAVVNDDVDGNGTAVVFNHRLPGQYLDLESGLSYNRFRYYSSSLGRFIISDPIGLRGGINTYIYVFNNPLYWIDLFGLNGNWNITGGQDGTRGDGGGEMTFTCTCDNGDQVATVTRDKNPDTDSDGDGKNDDPSKLLDDILKELDKDYDPDLFCGG